MPEKYTPDRFREMGIENGDLLLVLEKQERFRLNRNRLVVGLFRENKDFLRDICFHLCPVNNLKTKQTMGKHEVVHYPNIYYVERIMSKENLASLVKRERGTVYVPDYII